MGGREWAAGKGWQGSAINGVTTFLERNASKVMTEDLRKLLTWTPKGPGDWSPVDTTKVAQLMSMRFAES
jgi:hypothetical protein